MYGQALVGHHGQVITTPRWPTTLASAVYLIGAGLQIVLSSQSGLGDPVGVLAVMLAVQAVPVVLGVLIGTRVPANPVGPALAWVGAAPTMVFAVEFWGQSARTTHPWPAAEVLYHVQLGAWVWNLAGFVALCLVFPDGLLPGRRWRTVAWVVAVVAVGGNVICALLIGDDEALLVLPVPVTIALYTLTFAGYLAALAVTVVALRVRYRRGDERVRQQLRWLLLGAGTVPVLLAMGWVLQAAGFTPGLAYLGFLLAMLLAVPLAVAVAVLRYDLFDIDRLLGESLAWLVTTVLSAAVFAGVVLLGGELGADNRLGITGAAFATALLLLPLHRRLNRTVGRVVDRDRFVVSSRVRRFVHDVRDGTAEPEQVEELFRSVLDDPRLRLLLRLPGAASTGYVDLTGAPAEAASDLYGIPLRSGDADVGLLLLGTVSARRIRRSGDVAVEARLPIEVCRLRLELRSALTDVQSSQSRLMHATAQERRRLEQDLHDGAQQQIVAAGMRLRSVQRRLEPSSSTHRELDAVVEALEDTVSELRRLAHGIRPSRLDDGLQAALHALVADSPVPVRLDMAPVEVPDVVATMVYFVVAEAYANALKHANARLVLISLTEASGALHIEVADDGIGGASPNLTAVRDRVAWLGGVVSVDSPPGGGTRVQVEIADAHRGG
jgi:signal transduction histidine kinase